VKVVLVTLYDINNFAVRILKTILDRNGHDTRIVAHEIEYGDVEKRMTPDEQKSLIDEIHSYNPDVVGFTLRSMVYQEFKNLAPKINARIIVGGQHPTVCPEDFDGYTVCVGEGEDVICDIIDGRDGIVYGGMAKDINIIPSMFLHKSSKMSVITCRGCFFGCSYCYNSLQRRIISGWKPRRRDVDNVIKEIEILIDNNELLEEIVFSDSVFTWDYDWLYEFCKYFKKTGLKFRCFCHFGLCDSKILELIHDSGCYMVTSGIQGSQRVRKKYFNKHETDDKIIEGAKKIHKSGILGRYDIIRNIPYETEEDRESVKDLLDRIPRPFITRSFDLLNNPKTELTERLLKDNHITQEQVQGSCIKSYRINAEFKYYN